MADTKELGKMLDNLINNKGEQAQVHFHDYLQGKMQEVIHGDAEVPEEPDTTKNDEE
jgi:hypothetical protein